eukprot:2163554-Lingulodinium_polyedra.AAC.1
MPIRTRCQESILVESSNMIPDDEAIIQCLPCWAYHYGLCATEDAACYRRVEQMARDLEGFFKKDMT